MSTKLDKNIEYKIRQTYSILIALGCQLIDIHPLLPTNYKKIQQTMQIYYQACQSRFQLIQWLIATIYPYYDQNPAFKTSYDDDPSQHKLKKLSLGLWQLGVMPVSKHTKNLDYQKYIEGLLGEQNSVNLIYDLAIIASHKYSNWNKIDTITNNLLQNLIKNKQQLVNPEYDPYGVTFPPKFYTTKDIDESRKIVDHHYEQILKDIQIQIQSYNADQEDQNGWKQSEDQQIKVFSKIQTYKSIFQHKYKKLLDKILQLQPKIQNLGLNEPQICIKQQQQQNDLHSGRMLKISKQFCTQYKQYKQLTANIKPQIYDQTLQQATKQLLLQINKINQINDINLQ